MDRDVEIKERMLDTGKHMKCAQMESPRDVVALFPTAQRRSHSGTAVHAHRHLVSCSRKCPPWLPAGA